MDKYIVIAGVEDGDYKGKPHKKVIDKQGQTHKIGQSLEAKWYMLAPDAAIRLTMDTFKKEGTTYKYVKDIEAVKSIFEKEAAKKVAEYKSLKDLSIEAQVAVKIITDLEIAGKDISEKLMCLRNTWLIMALEENQTKLEKGEDTNETI